MSFFDTLVVGPYGGPCTRAACRDPEPWKEPERLVYGWLKEAHARGLVVELVANKQIRLTWTQQDGYRWRDPSEVRANFAAFRAVLAGAKNAEIPFAKRPISELPIVIVDLETTGTGPDRDRICEVAACRIDPGGEETWFSSLVDPCVPIRNSAIHGITDAMVRGKPLFSEIFDRIAEVCEGAVFVSHSSNSFDSRFLGAEARRMGASFDPEHRLQTVPIARKLLPDLASHSLTNLVSSLNLPRQKAHRAEGDVRMTLALWERLQVVASKRPRPPITIEDWSKL